MRPFITWNPILHGVELFRYSINNEYPIPDISLSYLMLCSILMLSFSLILYRTNESLLLESNDDCFFLSRFSFSEALHPFFFMANRSLLPQKVLRRHLWISSIISFC